MIDNGHLVLADLNIQLDHISAPLEGIVKRIDRILEHLLRLVVATSGTSSAMTNVQTGLLQLPVAGVAGLEAHLDHRLGLGTSVGACDKVLGCKRGRENLQHVDLSCSLYHPQNTLTGWYSVRENSATFYASHQLSGPRGDGHRHDAIRLLHVQRVDVTEGDLLVHVRAAVLFLRTKAARLMLLKVKSSSLEEVHSHALEKFASGSVNWG